MADTQKELAHIIARMREESKGSFWPDWAKTLKNYADRLEAIAYDINNRLVRMEEEAESWKRQAMQYRRDLIEAKARAKQEVQDALDAGGFAEAASNKSVADDETQSVIHNGACERQNIHNVAKLREALERILDYWGHLDFTYPPERKLRDAAREALATPPRNCDRFATLEEALEHFEQIYFGPTEPEPVSEAFERWLFAAAEGDKK